MDLATRRRAEGSPRDVRGFGSCERQFRRREPTEPTTMPALSIKSRNTKSAAPKKGSAQSKTASRRKVTSPAANAKKPTRSVESKTERVAAAKTHAPEPTRGGQHRRDDAGDRLAAAQRARVPGGHGEKEARLFANILEAQRGRSPLPHRNAARPVRWKNGRSMSQRRSHGSRIPASEETTNTQRFEADSLADETVSGEPVSPCYSL